MRSREFTQEEREHLESNPNVLKVNNSNITYTDDFKQLALSQYKDGYSPREIFIEAGIDLSIFPNNYARYAIKRWKTKQRSNEPTKKRTGRPKKTSNMTQKEMEARIAYLEAENNFLKKLRALEESE